MVTFFSNYNGNCNTTSTYKNFLKKRKRIDAIKRGGTRGQIDDIIHNSSYRRSDSAFLTEFRGGFKKCRIALTI